MKIKTVRTVLRFLRLTDESNNLSLTNLIVLAITVKLLLMPEIDATVMTGFIMALFQYGHKRHVMLNSEVKKAEQRDLTGLIKKEIQSQTATQDEALNDYLSSSLEAMQSQIDSQLDNIEKLKVQTGLSKNFKGLGL